MKSICHFINVSLPTVQSSFKVRLQDRRLHVCSVWWYELLESLTDNANAQLYVTKFSTISIYLTKLFVFKSVAIASSLTYSEISPNFSNSARRGRYTHYTGTFLHGPLQRGMALECSPYYVRPIQAWMHVVQAHWEGFPLKKVDVLEKY